MPAWSYIPVDEYAVIDAAPGVTSLASDLGPLRFDFIGDFTWDARTQVRPAFGTLCMSSCSGLRRTCWQVSAGT